MFRKVLIANRGAIACRIIRTLRRLGNRSVAVYSDADRHSLHVIQADEAVRIGPAQAGSSYLSISAILEAARATNADAIHPGYGFLSERPEFAEACEESGIVFIGPTSHQMRAFALKHSARLLAAELGIPLLPATGLLAGVTDAIDEALRIGYPVMLKSTAGGGGIGMRLCQTPDELETGFMAVQRQGANSFGDGGVFIERFIERARHIEVQIFGDGRGNVIALGDRDCSIQRRNQKVIEETPAPGISETTRASLFESSVKIASAVDYRSAGTVEYVFDDQIGAFYFLEVNARLQVEHGVTEEVTGVDLVEWMVRNASGDLPPLSGMDIKPRGCSFEARLYAEDAGRNFQPSSGRLTTVVFPAEVRVETWVEPGTEITPWYDPMVAKLIVRGETRPEALAKLATALDDTQISGIETNLDYLRQIARSVELSEGAVKTAFLGRFVYNRMAIEVIRGGAQTTVQDYPGRTGYWNVGVPPSGPMDSLSFRLANRLVGNALDAAAFEMTIAGPELRFSCETVIALAGAAMDAKLDNVPVPFWTPTAVSAGSVLTIGSADAGMRAYLAVAGGLAVPPYLGSGSTFMLGNFGGHAGRSLQSGDVIHLNHSSEPPASEEPPSEFWPRMSHAWEVGVLYGPHGAPDFFTESDILMLMTTRWTVHHQSDRTGVRLIGPKPQWARPDGGDAGLHPSNIHDNPYAIGTIDFTGDMPIILGPDGPSLGGFVCPVTIAHAELWKIGQLRPGDSVLFVCITFDQADAMAAGVEAALATLKSPLPGLPPAAATPHEPAILAAIDHGGDQPSTVVRMDGDRYLLVEFGQNILDLALRIRVHALETKIRALNLPGIVNINPGVRSLQVHYDSTVLPRRLLLDTIVATEKTIPAELDMTIPARILRLPLSWDDPGTRLAAEKYMQSVRPDAPWCPDNIEFIRRINGLNSVDAVQRTILNARYLVLGLGDVYLGAPVATPVDPRHRLVTTKYNPARTWTPENAVGIGGAYMCVYGMEGPGGYQLFGRTIQVWNTFKTTHDFEPGQPWLLRCFDQIQFYLVSASELIEMRDAFPHGEIALDVHPMEFQYGRYRSFIDGIAAETAHIEGIRKQAFADERARWAAAEKISGPAPIPEATNPSIALGVPAGCDAVTSPLTAIVWKTLVEPGQHVELGEGVIVLEAMKTEILLTASVSGTVVEVRTPPETFVRPGQELVILRP